MLVGSIQTKRQAHLASVQNGTTLIEVLITILILAFGLLGLAGMLSQTQKMEYESFQRAQAVLLVGEMVDRMSANRINAPSYVMPVGSTVGTGSVDAPCPQTPIADRDLCEWTRSLKGSTETLGNASVGAMAGARGCIAQLQPPDPATGVCKPGIYQVSVAWQGLYPTKAQTIACGTGFYGGDDSLRRSISSQISISLPGC